MTRATTSSQSRRSRRILSMRRRIAVEVAAAELAAEHARELSFSVPNEHVFGWVVHVGWNRGLAVRVSHEQLLRSRRAEVGYLARQIICGDEVEKMKMMKTRTRTRTGEPPRRRG